MSLVRVKTKLEFFKTLESIEDTIVFDNLHTLKNFMLDIRFVEIPDDYFGGSFVYSNYSGIVGSHSVYLSIGRESATGSLYICKKEYYQSKIRSRAGNGYHRSNDLPALIQYSESGDAYKVEFYINGNRERMTDLPVSMNFELDSNKVTYHYCNYDDYSKGIYFLYGITLREGKVIKARFQGKGIPIELQQIIDVIPRTKHFSHKDLKDLKKKLTPEELALLDMFFI